MSDTRPLNDGALSPSVTACLRGGRRPADPAEGDLHKRLKHRALPVVRQRLPHRLTDLAHGVTPAIEPAREARRGRSSAVQASRSNYQRHHEWDIEDIFRTTKAILDTRPIYHQKDATIRGHVFCSFLALMLRKALEDRLAAARMKTEWGALIRELDRLQEVETEQDGKHFILRTPATGDVGNIFRAVGIALPPNIRDAEASQSVD